MRIQPTLIRSPKIEAKKDCILVTLETTAGPLRFEQTITQALFTQAGLTKAIKDALDFSGYQNLLSNVSAFSPSTFVTKRNQ